MITDTISTVTTQLLAKWTFQGVFQQFTAVNTLKYVSLSANWN